MTKDQVKVKIAFPLERDESGYPPFDAEDLWATPTTTTHEFVVENVPFFATQATIGDVVRARVKNSQLFFEAVIKRSRRSLIRVIVYDTDAVPEIRDELTRLGCATALYSTKQLIAVDVPEHWPLTAVQDYLAELEAQKTATYEEPILRH